MARTRIKKIEDVKSQKIDFSKTFIENQQISKIDKELLLQLYKDGFLGVVENEKIYIK